MIIDFHTHTFPDRSSEKIVNHLAHIGCIPPHTDGSVIGLFSSMKEADIDYSVNLPVMTKPSQVEKVNSSLIQQQEYLPVQTDILFITLRSRKNRIQYR